MIWGQYNEEKKENVAKKEELKYVVVVDKEGRRVCWSVFS